MPDIGVAPAIYPARPTIKIDGQDQPGLSDGLQELLVEDSSAGMLRCEATFANWGPKDGGLSFLFFDRQLLDFGKSIRIEMGAGNATGEIFEGRMMAISGRFLRQRPPEVLILAEDRLQDLRMTRRTRSFENVSDADVFQQVASQQGLQAQVDASGPTHKTLTQLNQSDLAFLRERARAVDAELWLEGTTLNVKSRSRRSASDVTLTFGQGLLEFSCIADLAHQSTGFQVSGWDVSAKNSISFKATDSALSGELNGDRSGASILQQAFGERDQQVVHRMPADSQEAQSLAEAYFRGSARRFVTGSGIAEGDPRLRVGTRLELKGIGSMFEGKYYVTRVRHIFDSVKGFRTAFEVERPGVGRG